MRSDHVSAQSGLKFVWFCQRVPSSSGEEATPKMLALRACLYSTHFSFRSATVATKTPNALECCSRSFSSCGPGYCTRIATKNPFGISKHLIQSERMDA